MLNYRADPDIDRIFGDGGISIPPGVERDEAARISTFIERDRIVVEAFRRGERPSDQAMNASVRAAMEIYDRRSAQLPVGWQKFAVLQAGLLAIELESSEVMEWAYRVCKHTPGWLGDFDQDVDRHMPLREMTQQIPATAVIHFQAGLPEARPAIEQRAGSGWRTLDDREQARELLREFVQGRYSESGRDLGDDFLPGISGGWLIEHEGGICLLRVPDVEQTIVTIRAGVAVEIPRCEELAYHVACANKQIMVGRAFMGYGDEFALVVLEDIVRGRAISWDFEPSIEDVVSRFEYVIQQSSEMRKSILERFGGRTFRDEDTMLLVW